MEVQGNAQDVFEGIMRRETGKRLPRLIGLLYEHTCVWDTGIVN